MAGNYINRSGIAAGPIRITDITDNNFNGHWIVSYDGSLHVQNTWVASPTMPNYYGSIFADTPTTSPDGTPGNMLVTADWVRNYYEHGDPGDSSSVDPKYVLKTDYNKLLDIVMGEVTEYEHTEPLVTISSVAYSNAQTALNNTVTLTTNLNSVSGRLDTLNTSFTAHITNPFPEGVIFIGGGANDE